MDNDKFEEFLNKLDDEHLKEKAIAIRQGKKVKWFQKRKVGQMNVKQKIATVVIAALLILILETLEYFFTDIMHTIFYLIAYLAIGIPVLCAVVDRLEQV